MKITFLTLFPEMYEGFLTTSIIKRAQEKKAVEFEVVNIRDYSLDKHHRVDDIPYGGGSGMVMSCQPVLDSIKAHRSENDKVVLMAPNGSVFNQQIAHQYTEINHLILLCGHYEGIDERIMTAVDEKMSIGDYVLTGGELPSMVIADAVTRLLDGVITGESWQKESFENGLLEHPQYTRPVEYDGMKVPEVLFSGHHKNIARYQLKESLRMTLLYRPDLLKNRSLSKEEKELLYEIKKEQSEEK